MSTTHYSPSPIPPPYTRDTIAAYLASIPDELWAIGVGNAGRLEGVGCARYHCGERSHNRS